MKIEKINDDQIRCILTGKELSKRNLSVQGLAYGTADAAHLFRDILSEAALENGFTADNTPVTIDAVPLKDGGLSVIITRTEDPEELDARYSRFSPAVERAAGGEDDNAPSLFERLMHAIKAAQEAGSSGNDDSLPFPDIFNGDNSTPAADTLDSDAENGINSGTEVHRIFHFSSVDSAIKACRAALKGNESGLKSSFSQYGSDDYRLDVCFAAAQKKDARNNIPDILSEYCLYETDADLEPETITPESAGNKPDVHVICREQAIETLALLG